MSKADTRIELYKRYKEDPLNPDLISWWDSEDDNTKSVLEELSYRDEEENTLKAIELEAAEFDQKKKSMVQQVLYDSPLDPNLFTQKREVVQKGGDFSRGLVRTNPDGTTDIINDNKILDIMLTSEDHITSDMTMDQMGEYATKLQKKAQYEKQGYKLYDINKGEVIEPPKKMFKIPKLSRGNYTFRGQYEGIVDRYKSGRLNEEQMYEVLSALNGEDLEEKSVRIAALVAEQRGIPYSQAYYEFLNQPDWSTTLKRLAIDPIEIISHATVESLSQFLPAFIKKALVTVPTGAGMGGAAGSAFGGIGALPGAVIGAKAGMNSAVGITSFNMEYTGKILEIFSENGVDVSNPNELLEAFQNKELLEIAKIQGMKKGIPIAILDMVSAGIAGKIGKPLLEVGSQMALGAAGEYLGQKFAGEELNAPAVVIEAFAEVGQAAPSGAVNIAMDQQSKLSDAKFNKTKIGQELQTIKAEGTVEESVINMAIKLAKQNPEMFEGRSVLNFINDVREITAEQLRADGRDAETFFEEHGAPSNTEESQVLGSTLERNGQVLINLYKGATADTVLEEFYGNAYKNLPDEDRAIWDAYYAERAKEGETLKSQELFEKEGKAYYYGQGYDESNVLVKIFKKIKSGFNNMFGKAKLPAEIRKMYRDAGLGRIEPKETTVEGEESFQITPTTFSIHSINEDPEYPTFNNIDEIASHLSQRSKKLQEEEGVDLTDMSDNSKQIIAETLAAEIKTELENPANAGSWYTQAVSNAFKILKNVIPEIDNSSDRSKINVGIAVTSNGTAVQENLSFGVRAWEWKKENGEFPTHFQDMGTETKVINQSFKLYNDLANEMGEDALIEFLNTEFDIKELTDKGFKVSGELMNTKVPGAIIFGPKIGGAFYANLQGDLSRLTMDRWFTRTWGRITGTIQQEMTPTIKKNFTKFKSMVRNSKKRMEKYGLSREDTFDDAKMLVVAKKVFREFGKDWSKDTTINKLSRSIVMNTGIENDPRTGTNRANMRDVMSRTVEILNDPNISIADAQALLWFPEKRLFSKLRGKPQKGSEEISYEEAAKNYARERGVSDARIEQSLQEESNIIDQEDGQRIDEREVSQEQEVTPAIEEGESFQLTPAQQEHFKDTKAINEDGTPLRVYHGTNAEDFSVFKSDDSRKESLLLGTGYYFTMIPEEADRYAAGLIYGTPASRGMRIIPAYLNLKNPFYTRSKNKWTDKGREALKRELREWGGRKEMDWDTYLAGKYELFVRGDLIYQPLRGDALQRVLKANGNDGVIDGSHFVAYYPEQIKSPFNVTPIETGESFQVVPKEELVLEDESIVQKLSRAVVDEMSRLKYIQKKIGDKIPEKEDAYMFFQNMYGRVSSRIEDARNQIFKNKDSILYGLRKEGYTVDDLGEYLYALHSLERDRTLKQRGLEKGSGMSAADRKAIIKKYKGTKMDEVAKSFKESVIDRALDLRLEYGLIDQNQYNLLKKTYKNYVPLKGLAGEDGMSYSAGSGFSVGTTGIFRAKGRDSRAVNPAVQAIIDLESAISLTEKNRAMTSFYNLLSENPHESWSIAGRKHKPVYDENGDMILMPEELDDNQVQVFIDGEKKVITLDPELMKSMGFLKKDKKNKNDLWQGAVRGLNTFNWYFRMVNTQFSPDFIITNFERDLQSAMINLSADGVQVKGNILGGLPEAWQDIRNNSPIYQEFKNNGGKAGWMDFKTLDQTMDEINSEISKFEKSGDFKTALFSIGQYVQDMNEAVENVTRLSTYKAMKDAGATSDQAANYAKDLTVNFNKKGEAGTIFNLLWVFSNAGIQGTNRIFRALTDPKSRDKAWKLMGGIMAAGFMQSMFNRWMDEDDWDQFSDHDKDNYHLLIFPNGKALAVKLPYGYNVPFVIGSLAEQVINGDLPYSEALYRLMKSGVDAFSPIGSGSNFAAPTIARPIFQLADNENYFGGPIANKQPFNNRKASEEYYKSVRHTTKTVTTWLSEVTGGTPSNKRRKKTGKEGLIEINPEYVDHLIESYGGSAGRLLYDTFNAGINNLVKDEKIFPTFKNTPIIRQFVKEKSDYQASSVVWGMMENSKTKIFTPAQRKRFFRQLTFAKKSGQVDRKQYNKLKKEFKRNQKRIGR